jgi:methionyl-tRNA formyltransferase
MNWTIIGGWDRFYAHLLRYDEGVDSGPIVDTAILDVHPRETIRSLTHKVVTATIQMLLRHLPALAEGRMRLTPQAEAEGATYLPARVPEDGVIDWKESVARIDRLVRAVTRPYPGAFTWDGDAKVFLWQGWPNGNALQFGAKQPGDILAAYADGTFLVQAADGPFFVDEWEAPVGWRPRVGSRFRSVPNESWIRIANLGGRAI